MARPRPGRPRGLCAVPAGARAGARRRGGRARWARAGTDVLQHRGCPRGQGDQPGMPAMAAKVTRSAVPAVSGLQGTASSSNEYLTRKYVIGTSPTAN